MYNIVYQQTQSRHTYSGGVLITKEQKVTEEEGGVNDRKNYFGSHLTFFIRVIYDIYF